VSQLIGNVFPFTPSRRLKNFFEFLVFANDVLPRLTATSQDAISFQMNTRTRGSRLRAGCFQYASGHTAIRSEVDDLETKMSVLQAQEWWARALPGDLLPLLEQRQPLIGLVT